MRNFCSCKTTRSENHAYPFIFEIIIIEFGEHPFFCGLLATLNATVVYESHMFLLFPLRCSAQFKRWCERT